MSRVVDNRFFWLLVAAVGLTLFVFAEQAAGAAPKLGRLVSYSQYTHRFGDGKRYACVQVDYTRGMTLECVRVTAAKAKTPAKTPTPAKGAA